MIPLIIDVYVVCKYVRTVINYELSRLKNAKLSKEFIGLMDSKWLLLMLWSRFTVSYTFRMATYWNLPKGVLAVLQVLVNVGFLIGTSKMMGFVMMGNKRKMEAAMW